MAFWVETLNSLSTEPSSTCQLQQRDTVACSWARCCYSDMIAWSTALSTSMYGAEGSLEPHDVTMSWMQPRLVIRACQDLPELSLLERSAGLSIWDPLLV